MACKKDAPGEVLVEYFVIFVVVAFLTIVGLTSFDEDLKTNLTGYFQTASAKLIGPDSASSDDTCQACSVCDVDPADCCGEVETSDEICDDGQGCVAECKVCSPCA